MSADSTVMNARAAREAQTATSWTRADVIKWWELRRILFNLALLVVGLTSVAGAMALWANAGPADDTEFSSLGLFFGVALYALGANAFYTLGWIVELIVRRFDIVVARKSAKVMWRWGLIGSCVVTSAPLWIALMVWIVGHAKKT
jgi:hypothetical protein